MYTVVVYKILSDFRFVKKKEWIVKTPKYSKSNPRPKNIEINQIYQNFCKKEQLCL